jgi:hypothetical protein
MMHMPPLPPACTVLRDSGAWAAQAKPPSCFSLHTRIKCLHGCCCAPAQAVCWTLTLFVVPAVTAAALSGRSWVKLSPRGADMDPQDQAAVNQGSMEHRCATRQPDRSWSRIGGWHDQGTPAPVSAYMLVWPWGQTSSASRSSHAVDWQTRVVGAPSVTLVAVTPAILALPKCLLQLRARFWQQG